MLTFLRTSLMESKAQTLVNTVNCVGVMGKGIAAEFKARYPEMFRAYKQICDDHLLAPGKLWLWSGPDRKVLNFPTKQHWRNPSKLEWVEAGLQKFVKEYERRGITEVSFPRLGCGNGGLDWDDVKPLMERYLERLPIKVFIHDYAKSVELPEHLELFRNRLIQDGQSSYDYGSFVKSLAAAFSISEAANAGKNPYRFEATITEDLGLELHGPTELTQIEPEDLRSLWLTLLKGFVTRETAAWAAGESGEALMAALSVVPGVRGVEIQRPKQDAEVAYEFRAVWPARTEAPPNDPQGSLQWH